MASTTSTVNLVNSMTKLILFAIFTVNALIMAYGGNCLIEASFDEVEAFYQTSIYILGWMMFGMAFMSGLIALMLINQARNKS